MQKKYEKLIRVLEDKQDVEFKRYGKSNFFLFLEDVIGETQELYERWKKEND